MLSNRNIIVVADRLRTKINKKTVAVLLPTRKLVFLLLRKFRHTTAEKAAGKKTKAMNLPIPYPGIARKTTRKINETANDETSTTISDFVTSPLFLLSTIHAEHRHAVKTIMINDHLKYSLKATSQIGSENVGADKVCARGVTNWGVKILLPKSTAVPTDGPA